MTEQKLKKLIGLIGLIGLMGCGGGDDSTGQPPTPPPTPPTPTTTEVAISFSGAEEESQSVEQGGNRANRASGQLASRRAGTPLSEKAQAFTVWGFKNMSYTADSYGDLQTVFPGYYVRWINGSAATTTSNTNGWEYVAQQTTGDEQTIKYWDMGAKAYRYFAVTGVLNGANGPSGPTKPSGDNGPYEFTMTADASDADAMEATPYFSKLWFSTGNAVTYPDKQFGKPVTLEFLKPFARVRFLFNYSYAQEGVKVTTPVFKPTTDFDVDPANHVKIALKGTFTVSYPLTGTATKETYTITKEATPTEQEVLTAFTEEYIPGGNEKWYIVFPATTQGSYTMSVTVNATTRTAVVPAEYMSWLPGYSYTYIFKITEEGGVEIDLVQSAVTAWTEMEIDHTVYNW